MLFMCCKKGRTCDFFEKIAKKVENVTIWRGGERELLSRLVESLDDFPCLESVCCFDVEDRAANIVMS